MSRLPAMGADLDPADFETLIPAEKNLDPRWVESLFARGTPEVHRGDELRFIGMPVGGIGAGQVYLGGDGKLWHWDIFNKPINSGNTGPHYFRPLTQKTPFGQGFALRVLSGGATVTQTLDAKGFREIVFRGEYPLGYVDHADPEVPITVRLEAFSPFFPLNAVDSGLPATASRFTVKNAGPKKVDVELAGWLENPVCLESGKADRRHRLLRSQLLHRAASLRQAGPQYFARRQS